MKRCLMALLPALISSFSIAQRPYTEPQVIAYAKNIDVKTLDASLPSQRLEDWLENGPPHANIRWDVSDTCDNHPYKDEDYPLCAKIWFSRNGEAGSFLVEVGTRHKGIGGVPQLHYGIIGWEDGPGWIMTGGAEKLSGLTALLDQPAFAHDVGLLYGEIVAHHPIGIPTGTKMAVIRPLLSKRLAGQLETAKACEADYLRQPRNASDGTSKPAWLKSGLFSGDGNRAFPESAWPVREGPQKDGSFLVYVNLFAQTIDLGNGFKAGAYSESGNWRVGVRVVAEEGRYVVDDVRMFDGTSTEGPSRVLSDSFVGCDGSHWIGMPSARFQSE